MSGFERFDPLAMPLDGLRLVEASAGTGKTFSLAGLYLRLLLERRLDVREILVVTFTRAATQELRERIRARLALAARLAAEPQRADEGDAEQGFILAALSGAAVEETRSALAWRLQEAAARMDEAAITTIHGFAQQAAAEHAFESVLPFDRGEQVDDRELHAEVLTDYWRGQVLGRPAPEARAFLDLWPSPQALWRTLEPLRLKPHLSLLAGSGDDEIERLAAEARRCWPRDRAGFAELLETALADDELMRNGGLYKALAQQGGVESVLAAVDDGLRGSAAGHAALPAWLADLGDEAGMRRHFKQRAVKAGYRPQEIEAVALLAELQPLGRLAALRAAQAHLEAEAARRKRERRQFSFADMIEALHDAITDPARGSGLSAALQSRWPWALVDEFQDTDPRQYRILSRMYHGRAHGGLILIGDPKQAIYGFRGGDVFAYLQAASQAEGRYGLDTNFRSTAAMLAAVERLFASAGVEAFIIEQIRYQSVRAGRAEGDRVLMQDRAPLPAMTLWPLEEDAPGAPLNKGEAQRRLRDATLARIGELLSPGRAAMCEGGSERPVEPGDIAVLVNTNREAAEMQAALGRYGIAAVCLHQQSVFATREAAELLELLRAAATPADEEAVRVALVTSLRGCRQGDIIALHGDEHAWQAEIERFQAAHERWREAGVLAMLEPLLQEAAPRLLALEDGERRMTNFLQLAELLQGAEAETFGMAGQIRWLAEAIGAEEQGEGESAESVQLRLESDEALVRIATVHRVKGLQYPIVFLPYAAFLGSTGTPDKPPFVFHDAQGRAWLDPGTGQDEAHRAPAVREARAEAVRLLYVAITRAEQACFLGWGAAATAADSALAWLLHRADGAEAGRRYGTRKLPWLNGERVRARLEALAEDAPREDGQAAIAVTELPQMAPRARHPVPPEPPEGEARSDLPAPRPPWAVFSFSRLVRGAGRPEPRSGADDEARDAPDPAGPDGAGATAARASAGLDMLRGPAFGSALHELLEGLEAGAAGGSGAASVSAGQARQALRNNGIALPAGAQGEALIETVIALIERVLATPLPELGPLAALPREARLPEMGFFLALGGGRVQRVLERLRAAGYAGALPAEQGAQRLRGLMQGYVDLVAEAGGRYYVIDYKSNWLGPSMADYGPDALTDLVRRGRYDLQYLIYLVALHRHLGERLPGYTPARHLGGVRYLFLRGMNGRDAATGVYVDRPDPELIRELDALLGAGETPP